MSLANNYAPVKQLGNGVTTVFTGPWNPVVVGALAVFLENVSTGVQTPVTTGITTEILSTGGFKVTFAVAPTSANYVVISRDTTQDQDVPYKTSKGFDGTNIEQSFDKLTAMVQELQDQLNRSMKFPLGSALVGYIKTPPSDGKTLIWSGNDLVAGPSASDIAAAQGAADAALASAQAAYLSEIAAANYAGNRLYVEQYGGSAAAADNKTAIDNLFAACISTGKTAVFGPFTYKSSGGHTWRYSKHAVECHPGCTLDFSQMTSGTAITVQALAGDTGLLGWSISKRWQGGWIKGNRLAGVIGFAFGDMVGTTLRGSDTMFEDVFMRFWGTCIKFGSHAYLNQFYNCKFGDAELCVDFPVGLTDSGERILFDGCTFYNSTNLVSNGGATIVLNCCSLDYQTGYMLKSFNGGVTMVEGGSHLEASSDTTEWLQVDDSFSQIILDTGDFYMGAFTHNNYIMRANPTTSNNGGIRINNFSFKFATGANYTKPTLGTGAIYVTQRPIYEGVFQAAARPYSDKTNLLVDGGFEQGATATAWKRADWKVVNGDESNFAVDNTVYATGGSTQSLKINPATGKQAQLRKTIPCGPGTQVFCTYKIKTSVGNATDTLTARITYYDAFGRNTYGGLSSPQVSKVYNQANAGTYTSFVEQNILSLSPAPRGTAYCQIDFFTNSSAVDGTTIFWLDDMFIEVASYNGGNLHYDGNNGTSAAGFTPTAYGVTTAGTPTYVTQHGRYTLLGQRVHFNLLASWSAMTGAAGVLELAGLPFTANADIDIPVNIGSFSGISITAGNTITARVLAGTRKIRLYQTTAAGVESAVNAVTGAASISLSGHYELN